MGFFQDLKEDLSLAVNELLPEDEAANKEKHDKEAEDDDSVENAQQLVEAALAAEFIEGKADNKESEETKVIEDETESLANELTKALEEESFEEDDIEEEGLEDKVPNVKELQKENDEDLNKAENTTHSNLNEESEKVIEDNQSHNENHLNHEKKENDTDKDAKKDEMNSVRNEQEKSGSMEPLMEAAAAQIASIAHIVSKDEIKVDKTDEKLSKEDFEERRLQTPEELLSNMNSKADETEIEKEVKKAMAEQKMNLTDEDVADETAVITAGMGITGDITSRGSLEVLGKVIGNIEVLGKLNVSGNIEGDSKAAEVFADSAHVTGMIKADGTVKIGQNSVIIGNISASSAVIAGAVKGDIDVMGPVILDASAVVMGNIKSKSVQINNGAVIEGMCSQCYAEVNPTSFFEQLISK